MGKKTAMVKRYYSLAVEEDIANIYIYGDIVSWEWLESDVSSYTLAKEIEVLSKTVEQINVFINSYGGEVKEGLAIYNALKRHKAKVTTYCDGFACSAASVVFMAGDERVMSNASLLMIHNAWLYTAGDSNQLRKDADNLETITQASINAYMTCITVSEEELKTMMDDETWISAGDALAMGFATSIVNDEQTAVSQSVKRKLIDLLLTMQEDAKAAQAAKNIKLKLDMDKIIESVADKVLEQLKTEQEELEQEEPEEEPETDGGGNDDDTKEEPENKIKNLMTALFRQN